MNLKNSRYIGQALPRLEDARLLTGKGIFVDDFTRPDMAYAVVVRSQAAHGRLLNIDRSAALELPGVVAVLTATDLPAEIPRIPFRIAVFEDAAGFQQPVIASDKVRYVGEPVALIIAESRAIAEDAAEMVLVEIEELPAVASSKDSLAPKALLHEGTDTNVAFSYQVY
ncbi:xanthine dehydrogenase family protein molybdopterin-binding subunit, partial [Rhizobiaceae sp. 2RAB30]